MKPSSRRRAQDSNVKCKTMQIKLGRLFNLQIAKIIGFFNSEIRPKHCLISSVSPILHQLFGNSSTNPQGADNLFSASNCSNRRWIARTSILASSTRFLWLIPSSLATFRNSSSFSLFHFSYSPPPFPLFQLIFISSVTLISVVVST